MQKAFLLDRDGTINVDTGYVGKAEDVRLIDGVAEAIGRMNAAGYRVIVITNQSGVARGYFSMADVEGVHARINELLASQKAHIDAFYVCPHLKDAPVKEYARDCDCRKPGVALFRQAITDFALDPVQCYACGDKPRDIEGLTALGLPSDHLFLVDEQFSLLQLTDLLAKELS